MYTMHYQTIFPSCGTTVLMLLEELQILVQVILQKSLILITYFFSPVNVNYTIFYIGGLNSTTAQGRYYVIAKNLVGNSSNYTDITIVGKSFDVY